MKKLNDEQRKLIEDNYSLVKYFYGIKFKNLIDYDTYLGIAHVAICKAAYTYDSSKSKFTSYFFLKLKTDISRYFRSINSEVRRIHLDTISLESTLNGYDDENMVLENILPDKVDVVTSAMEYVYWKTIIDSQSEVKQKIIELRLQGYEQKEIGQMIGMTQQGVYGHLSRFKRAMGY